MFALVPQLKISEIAPYNIPIHPHIIINPEHEHRLSPI